MTKILNTYLVWAFAHTGYVTYPIYARGVELTIVALFFGFIFLKFDLLTTITAHFTYNMMMTGIILLRSSEGYYQLSGWIVVFILILPPIPGLYITIRRRLRNEVPQPESLTLSPIDKSDIEQLSTLPVKADWRVLMNQANRIILGLHVNAEIVGFATGFVDDKHIGYVDGLYVTPNWRRQYWGATLLDAILQELRHCGAEEIRVSVKPNENRIRSFLHNLFWRAEIEIMARDDSEQTVKTAIKSLFRNLQEEKIGKYDLEIPRNLM
jgi:GNAT superfamily N-acetyltransferase